MKKAYLIALAREFLKEFRGDPLLISGDEANDYLFKIETISWNKIGRFRVGNKYIEVNNKGEVVTEKARL